MKQNPDTSTKTRKRRYQKALTARRAFSPRGSMCPVCKKEFRHCGHTVREAVETLDRNVVNATVDLELSHQVFLCPPFTRKSSPMMMLELTDLDLEVGHTNRGRVILRSLLVEHLSNGDTLAFSPDQARQMAALLEKHAHHAEIAFRELQKDAS